MAALCFAASSAFSAPDRVEMVQAQDIKMLKALQSGNSKDLSEALTFGANPNSRFCTDNSDINVQLRSLLPCHNGLPPLWFILRRPESQQLALISLLVPFKPEWGMSGEDVIVRHILNLDNNPDKQTIRTKTKIGRLLVDNGLTVNPEWLMTFAEDLELNSFVGSNTQKLALLKSIFHDSSLSVSIAHGMAQAQSRARLENLRLKQAKEAAELARRRSIERNLMQVKTIGTSVCRLAKASYTAQWGEIMGKPMYNKPETRIFALSGLTEQATESRVQIRIKSIKMQQSNKLIDVDMANNELRINSLFWDDPSLWHVCTPSFSNHMGN